MDFSGMVTYAASSSLAAEGPAADSTWTAAAVDVSEGGLCLITKDAVKDKQILKINVPVPGLSLQIPTLVMVMWQRPHNGAYKVGMMFII